MENYIYVVHAYRWSDRNNHSYHVGVYSDKRLAIEAAEAEEECRGGKYGCEVLRSVMDGKNADGSPGTPHKVIREPTPTRLMCGVEPSWVRRVLRRYGLL